MIGQAKELSAEPYFDETECRASGWQAWRKSRWAAMLTRSMATQP